MRRAIPDIASLQARRTTIGLYLPGMLVHARLRFFISTPMASSVVATPTLPS